MLKTGTITMEVFFVLFLDSHEEKEENFLRIQEKLNDLIFPLKFGGVDY